MAVYAIDFETYFSKELSVQTHGSYNYTRLADIYLVAIVGDDGFEWVGNPLNFEWETITNHVWISHNRTFDSACFFALEFDEDLGPRFWHCTGDLCGYIGAPRNLKDASKVLFDDDVSKEVRGCAKGKLWPKDFTFEERRQMREYALTDSRQCLKIWTHFSDSWPDWERELSAHTSLICHRGVGIDLPLLKQSIQTLESQVEENKNAIPWAFETDKKGSPVPLLSPKRLKESCEMAGIPAPTTRKAGSPIYEKWTRSYDGKDPVIIAKAMGEHQSINRTIKVLLKMRNFSEPDPNSNSATMAFSLKYHGAHTGRWTGEGGFNIQNLNRGDVYGVHLRHHLIPRPGKEFVICDYSQIEAVLTLWQAGETRVLGMFADGMDIYEAHGRVSGLYDDPRPMKDVNPGLRQLCKARVLALGFGVGPNQFVNMAWTLARVKLTRFESGKNVRNFRRTSKEIVKLWARLEKEFRAHHNRDYFMELPSGRCLHYYDVKAGSHKASACYVLGERRSFVHPGLLTENRIQAIGRDILGIGTLRVEAAGYPVAFTAHDEIICEVDKGTGETKMGHIKELMTKTTGRLSWAKGLPLFATGTVSDRYIKD